MTRAALWTAFLSLAVIPARAGDVKGPVAPSVLPSGALPAAPALSVPADVGAGALPEGLPVPPAASEIPGLPPSAVVPPAVIEAGAAVPGAAVAVPVQPQGLKPSAGLKTPEPAGLKAADPSALSSEKPQAPAAPGAAAPPGAREGLSQLEEKVVPASGSDAAAGSAGFSSAFDGGAAKAAPTYRVQSHDGVPHIHAYHPEDDDGSFPSDDQGNPFIVPDHLKPLLPSAQDKAHWTGRITLHLHSVFSDGTLEPEELVQLAYDKGVREFSLTDHDTTAGTVRAWRKAKELGMVLHPGPELTARGGVHVGAIDVDIYNPKLVSLLARVRAMRYQRAQAIVNYLNGPKVIEKLRELSRQHVVSVKYSNGPGPQLLERKGTENTPAQDDLRHPNAAAVALERIEELRGKGIFFSVDEVVAHSKYKEGGTIELPHVARMLLSHGVIEHVDDAFNTVFKGDISGDAGFSADPGVDEVLETVHAAGGKAVFNHPYTVDGKSDDDKDRKALAILQKGMDSIEVYRPSHATSENGKRRADERVAKYLGWVDRFDLFAAPGADFHGTDTHLNTLVVWMPKNLAAQLKDRLKDANARALAAIEEREKTPAGSAALLALVPPAFWNRPEGETSNVLGQWRWLAGMAYVLAVFAVLMVGADLIDKLFASPWAKRRPGLANLVYSLGLLALPAVLWALAVVLLQWLGGA